jgi:hypothetical protein
MMHGHMNLKFASAKQAKEIFDFKNLKRRLHKTTAAIWFNKSCRSKQLTPTYLSIKINGNTHQDKNTLRAATHFRLNQEIKFLHIKKTKLNEQLYYKHLECAALWPNCWHSILSIIDNLQREMDSHYERLNKKLDTLLEKQKTPARRPQGKQPPPYPRAINLTNIQFTGEEQKLLDLGLQYNIQKPLKAAWMNLVLETERAIKLQDPFRIKASKKMKQLHNTYHHNPTHKRQSHILNQIKHKITSNNDMITRADKGKTTVIIYTHDHNDKVHTFLSENNFHIVSKDPTIKDHKLTHCTLQQCDKIIDKKQVKYLVQKNPTPPALNALLKLHKPEIPIRPVINNTNAPSHKAARRLNTILNNHLHLNNRYNTTSSNCLAKN